MSNRDFLHRAAPAGVLALGWIVFWIWWCAGGTKAAADVAPGRKYTVEAFTEDVTVRIECSGACDLDAMKFEAREAVGR